MDPHAPPLGPLPVALALATALLVAGSAGADPSGPDDPAYTVRDTQNIADAYGRISGPGGQLQNPAYLPALVTASTAQRVGSATSSRWATVSGHR